VKIRSLSRSWGVRCIGYSRDRAGKRRRAARDQPFETVSLESTLVENQGTPREKCFSIGTWKNAKAWFTIR
jgi:hypothetical protein